MDVQEVLDITSRNVSFLSWLTDSIIFFDKDKKEYELITKEDISDKIEGLLQNKKLDEVQDILTNVRELERSPSKKIISKSFRISMYNFIKLAYLSLKHKTTVSFILFNVLKKHLLDFLKHLEDISMIKKEHIDHLRELVQEASKEKTSKRKKYSRKSYSPSFVLTYSLKNVEDFVTLDLLTTRDNIISELDVNHDVSRKITAIFNQFIKNQLGTISKIIKDYLHETYDILISTKKQKIGFELSFSADSDVTGLYDELKDVINNSFRIDSFFDFEPENNIIVIDHDFDFFIPLLEDESGLLVFKNRIITPDNYEEIINEIFHLELNVYDKEEELDSQIKLAVKKGEFEYALELTNNRILIETRKNFLSWIQNELSHAFDFSQTVSLTLPEDLIDLSMVYLEKNTLNELIHSLKPGDLTFG